MAKQLLTRHTCTECICEEKLFGKSYSPCSHPTQVLLSDGAGDISTYGQGGAALRVSRDGGNPKSLLPKQKQGSIQRARPVQTLRKVIWEAFNVGMAARLLHRKAKLSSDLLACGCGIQQRSSHHSEPVGAFSSKRQQKRDQRGCFAAVIFFRGHLGAHRVGTGVTGW